MNSRSARFLWQGFHGAFIGLFAPLGLFPVLSSAVTGPLRRALTQFDRPAVQKPVLLFAQKAAGPLFLFS